MRVAIHQPEHMPWLGFFHKISMADAYVVLDNVQFRKNYFQNRNKIRTSNGWTWLTVPVNYTIETLIKDVDIASDLRWKKKWLDTIYFSYKKAKYPHYYFEQVHKVLNENCSNLSNLNISLIKLLCKFLEIKTNIIFASQLNVEGKGSDLLLNICKKLRATTYLSGISGKEYLRLTDFAREGIKIILQDFHHPIYEQLYKSFIPRMSVIDLLFNYGNKSLGIINGIDVPVMEEVFL